MDVAKTILKQISESARVASNDVWTEINKVICSFDSDFTYRSLEEKRLALFREAHLLPVMGDLKLVEQLSKSVRDRLAAFEDSQDMMSDAGAFGFGEDVTAPVVNIPMRHRATMYDVVDALEESDPETAKLMRGVFDQIPFSSDLVGEDDEDE